MPARTLLCECGRCQRCRKRVYMRQWYRCNADHVRRRQRAKYAAEGSGGKVLIQCAWCERDLITTRRALAGHGHRFCSRPCKAAQRRALRRWRVQTAKPTRSCLHCGAEMPQTMRRDAAYCSASCNSAAHSQTRKASARIGARQERIDRAYIVARDRGRCHICKKRCRRSELTIDHLIPLSRGGTHTPENLAVACLSCNCAKRDRAANEQLLLVG